MMTKGLLSSCKDENSLSVGKSTLYPCNKGTPLLYSIIKLFIAFEGSSKDDIWHMTLTTNPRLFIFIYFF